MSNTIQISQWINGKRNFTALCVLFLLTGMLFSAIDVVAQTDDEDLPVLELEFDRTELVIPCPETCVAERQNAACSDRSSREIKVRLVDEDGNESKGFWFEYITDSGNVTQTGDGVRWNLEGVGEGVFWLRVNVNRGFETIDVLNKSVELRQCLCSCRHTCAKVAIDADSDRIDSGGIVLIRGIQSDYFSKYIRFDWTVENGEIISGQGSRILKVRAGSGDALKISLHVIQESQDCLVRDEITIPIVSKNEDDQ